MRLRLHNLGGKAYFQNKFVESAEFLEEKKAQQILYPGVFGTQVPGGNPISRFWSNFWSKQGDKNVANTHQIMWGGKLLALWEGGGPPTELCPKTLEYKGEFHFDGSVKAKKGAGLDPPKGQFSYSAHPRVDEDTQTLCNFGLRLGMGDWQLTVYEHDVNFNLVHQRTIDLKESSHLKQFPVVHSWVITKHFYVFVNGPVEIDLWKSLTRRATGAGLDDVLLPVVPELNKDAFSNILLVPRPQEVDAKLNALAQAGEMNSTHKVLHTSPCFVYHHVNAFEAKAANGDLTVMVDSLAFDQFCPLDIYREGHDGRNGKLVRFHINPNAPPKMHMQMETLCGRCSVMPTYKSGLDTKVGKQGQGALAPSLVLARSRFFFLSLSLSPLRIPLYTRLGARLPPPPPPPPAASELFSQSFLLTNLFFFVNYRSTVLCTW
jgi:all-trans-8'-apo-beta-carotenal 15,15'-oxygenase